MQHGRGTHAGHASLRRHAARLIAIGLILELGALAGCSAPTDVVDLRDVAPATQVAMRRMPILPLGIPAPADVGSIGPIAGYGCGQTSDAANQDAVQQLQIKALQIRATAVTDVVIQPAGIVSGPCMMSFRVMAKGLAMAPRGIPSSY
jgi:hypothetical protein